MSEVHAWDLDGTIRPGSLLAEAVLHGIEEGFIDATKFENPATPTYGEVDYFLEAVTHRSQHDFRALTNRLSDEAREHAYPWAIERLDDQAQNGSIIVLSHSPAFLVKAYCRGLGVHAASGSYFHTSNLVFSGRAVTLDKGRHLTRHLRTMGIRRVASAAGDSLNDLPLLHRAERATVVNPNQALAEIALQNAWEIIKT